MTRALPQTSVTPATLPSPAHRGPAQPPISHFQSTIPSTRYSKQHHQRLNSTAQVCHLKTTSPCRLIVWRRTSINKQKKPQLLECQCDIYTSLPKSVFLSCLVPELSLQQFRNVNTYRDKIQRLTGNFLMFVLSNLVFSSFCISVLLFILHIVHDSITKKINSHFRLIIITTNRPIKLFLWMPAGIGKGGGHLPSPLEML